MPKLRGMLARREESDDLDEECRSITDTRQEQTVQLHTAAWQLQLKRAKAPRRSMFSLVTDLPGLGLICYCLTPLKPFKLDVLTNLLV